MGALVVLLVLFFIGAMICGVICGQIHEDAGVYGFILGPIGILIACGFCLKDISISLKKMAKSSNSNSGCGGTGDERVKSFGKRIKIKPLKF